MLGCYGGKEPGCLLPSFLVNGTILIEAGSAASALTVEEQSRLAGIVLSHAHLDHVAEIPYLADNIFGVRNQPLRIYGPGCVLEAFHKFIFNDEIWPDFSGIHSNGGPVIEFHPVPEGEEFTIESVRLSSHAVNHKVPTFGYLLRDGSGSVLYTADTGPTEAIWKAAREAGDLRAIITEVSFPNRLQEIADLAKHMTPAMLAAEVKKMPPGIPVYLFHEKPQFREELLSDLQALGEPRIEPLVQGETYTF